MFQEHPIHIHLVARKTLLESLTGWSQISKIHFDAASHYTALDFKASCQPWNIYEDFIIQYK